MYRSGNFQTWGGSGGGERPPFHLQDDEYLESIEYCQDGHLKGIRFGTNTGRKSQWYGKDEHINGNEQRLLQAAAGHTIIGLQRPHGFCKPIGGIEEAPVPTAGEDGAFLEIEPLPKSVPEGDIDLCGRNITLKQRFHGMAAFGCLCVIIQLVAALALGSEGQLGSRRSASILSWAELETDYNDGYTWGRGTFHARYDLWNLYVLDRDDDDEFHDEEITYNNCKNESPYRGSQDYQNFYKVYCEKLVAATEFARVTTFLALLLTVVGAYGLCRYRRSPSEATRATRFERCCGLLAVGGFIGLVGAANYSSKLATALENLDDPKDKGTNTCASGCALSLSFSLIAMVAGAAAVVLQRNYARAPEGYDPATRAKSTTGERSEGCFWINPELNETNHGCCAVPKGSCKGRAAQVMSILGLVLAVIFLGINIYTWALHAAAFFIEIGLPGAGIGIYIQFICLLLSVIAYSRGLCCVTGERGWNCTSIFLRVLSVLYVVAIACMAISHGRLDEMLDKQCDGCEDDWVHGFFSIMYACVFINLAFAAITAYLLKSAAPDWVDRDAVDGDDVEANNVEGNNVDVGAYGLSAVKSIHVQSGWYIDQVKFNYRSGTSRTWGGSGGVKRPSFCLRKDEYLESIEYYQDGHLLGIRFGTNTGRKSQLYCGEKPRNGSEQRLQAAAGHMIVGLQRIGYCAPIKGIEEEPLEAPAAPLAEEEA